jgi:hypothetical protein
LNLKGQDQGIIDLEWEYRQEGKGFSVWNGKLRSDFGVNSILYVPSIKKVFSIKSQNGTRRAIPLENIECHLNPENDESYKFCPHCGAKFLGWCGYDASTEKEFRVSHDWVPQHRDLSGPHPAFSQESRPLTINEILKMCEEEEKE